MHSTVKVSVYLWIFPRIRSWTSLAVSRGTMECGVVFMLGLAWVYGSVGVMVWMNVSIGGSMGD